MRLHHSGDFPSHGGWHLVSSPQHLGSGDLALEGVPLYPPGSTVPSGLRQHPSRRPVSPSPAPTSRVVYTHDRLSGFEKTVAGSNSFFATSATHRCSISFSPFRDPRSAARTRFSSTGTAFRLTRSIRWLSSAYSREAPGLHGDRTHSCDSPLGSAPLVFGPGPALAGSSSDPTVPSSPPALDSVSSSLPGSPSAQASCLATLQRFPRAAGFASAIAEQSSLARRPSSRAVYRVRWSIYHGWCHSNGHSVSNPTLAMVAVYILLPVHQRPWCVLPAWLPFSFICGFPFSPYILVFGSGASDLLRSFQLSSAERVLRPHTWDLSMVLTYLVSPAFEPLSPASFRALPLTTLFLLALATAIMSWGATGSLFHSHLCGWGCMPLLHPAVCRQVGVAHPFHPSLLLGDVLSRLCGWSWFRPPTMPGQGSPLVSASGQVFVYRSPSPFRVPSAPCSPFSTNAVSFFLGGGHRCCSGG